MTRTSGSGSCASCGAVMAADQRYCLECGKRRGEARVDHGLYLAAAASLERTAKAGSARVPEVKGSRTPKNSGAVEAAPADAVPPDPSSERAAGREVTPLMAAAGLAVLGVMLIAGVLIGRGGVPDQVAATPQVISLGAMPTGVTDLSGTPEEAGSEEEGVDDTSAKAGSKNNPKGRGAKGKRPKSDRAGGTAAAAAAAPDPVSPEALEQLGDATGEEFQEAQKRLPPEVAIPGEAPPTDNKAPGGDSAGDAMVIE